MSSVLVVQDWAMKYLPRKYRKSQTDWFAKRGISWHISVAFRKVSNQLEMLTLVHILQSCTQDYCTVMAVMADGIKQLKNTMPNLKNVSYRQDNAGCYHSGPTMICAGQIGAEHGVKIKRLDFSDPQGGKGACEQKAATIKSHLQLHLNSGNDIETPAQMCEAMLSSGGIPSLSITLCESVAIPKIWPYYKLDGVSNLYNVEFKKKGMRVWKAYGVGLGKLRSETCSSDELPSLKVNEQHRSEFSVVKRRAQQKTSQSANDDQESTVEELLQQSANAIFACPEEGCIKTFMRHAANMRHLDCGNHHRSLERETLFDKAALEYAQKLEGQATLIPQVSEVDIQGNGVNQQPMGWALKSTGSGRARFSEKQKSYLTTRFKIGEETGIKADPSAVARSMMSAHAPDGSLLFTSDDFLTAKQISGFFSRLASKKTLESNELIEDIEVAVREAAMDALLSQAARELAQKHPIVYESYNLCELVSKGKLNKFSIPVLINMCISLGIDISDVTGKRKKPYNDRVDAFCRECECKK